ncbi:MAG: hypothetical protein HFH73_02620 [Lachnospiraceae bacterium]|nr:hypothetical protein [Lachnospiraceae bacterium]
MGNEIGEISQIINTSIRGIDISVRLTKEILSMLKRLIEILEAATFRRGLRKTTGKTLLSTLKMKGNIFSAKMTEDVYKEFQSFLKRKGKKYGIQWANGPTLEKGFHRVFIAESDAELYKTFLEDYAQKNCKSKEEKADVIKNNSIEDLYTYMNNSGLLECSQEEYERAQIEVNGTDWMDRVDKAEEPNHQKKNQIYEGIESNKKEDLERSGRYQFINFSVKDLLGKIDETNEIVVADPMHDHAIQIAFKPEYLFRDGDNLTAAVPNERKVSVKNLVSDEPLEMSMKDYMSQRKDIIDHFDKKKDNVQPDFKKEKPLSGIEKNPNVVDITISKTLVGEEDERYFKTRIPGMYGRNEGFLWVRKENAHESHNGKSIRTTLNKEEKYNIYSAKGDILREMTGDELYSHYGVTSTKYENKKSNIKKNIFRTKRTSKRKNARK